MVEMPQNRKQNLDKVAWAWTENVLPENISDEHIACVYRLTLPKCRIGCKRNCRGNPFCLSGLGEARWLDETEVDSDDDGDLEIRESNLFVGLKNLGATCYVNSLLQLWFHNLAFRRAIFRWNPFEDSSEALTLQNDSDILHPPNSVVGHLQLLFGLMQFGKKKSLDPSEFIKGLDLEPSTQQDAQEFSKLFISLLEDSLREQSDPEVRNLINNNFKGEYSYITRCSKCENESVSPSLFYELELNVKGNKTLQESLSEFLKEEKLEGPNMYSCGVCQEKQEATRFIRLLSLPPVLNLQLMRFIYDRQKGQKKKINSVINFPDSIDMSTYLTGDSTGRTSMVYNLTAVLIHKGPSAYSGHYVAHICDQISGNWYKFNDENVEKMEGKKLKLGAEEDLEDGRTKPKQQKLGKSMLASGNAYMLVYTATSVGERRQPINDSDISPFLKKQIDKFNKEFDEFIEKAREEKRNRKRSGQVQKAEMASLLMSLPVDKSEEWGAISTKWLNHLLTNTKQLVGPVDNSKLVCSHNKLDPNALNDVKYININAASTIYEKYQGGPELYSNTAQCKECIVARCRGIRQRAEIAEDAKEISNLIKKKELNGKSFWVGKNSLRSWKKKALRILLEKEGEPWGSLVSKDPPDIAMKDYTDMNMDKCFNDNGATYNCDGRVMNRLTSNPENDVKNSPSYSVNNQFIDSDARIRRKCAESLSTLIDSLVGLANDVKSILSVFDANGSVSDLPKDSVNVLRKFSELCTSTGYKISDMCDKNRTFSESNKINNSGTLSQSSDLSNGQLMNGGYFNNVSEVKVRSKRKLELQDTKECSGDEGRTEEPGSRSDDEEEDDEDFNDDLVCPHGNMILEEGARRLICENTWTIIKKYFPEAREFPKDTPPCHQCECLASEDQVAKDLYKKQAQTQKELLQDLFLGRNRPKFLSTTLYAIPSQGFLEPWRKFIREAGRRDPLYSIKNSSLICPHGLLSYNPVLEEENSKVALVTEEEWRILSSQFSIDKEITVTFDNNGEVVMNPGICGDCMFARIQMEHRALLNYTKAKLYIRPVSSSPGFFDDKPEKMDCPPSPPSEGKVVKKIRTETEVVRRSSRHRKVRGEKEITISSDQTLKDLKLQVLQLFGVSPYDQHLITDYGQELVDDSATLSSLSIYPNSVIHLKSDEPTKGTSTAVEDFMRTTEPEAGFKGTGLMKRL